MNDLFERTRADAVCHIHLVISEQ